jgi:hypothetical protein
VLRVLQEKGRKLTLGGAGTLGMTMHGVTKEGGDERHLILTCPP